MIEKGEYKGNPVIILKRNEKDRFPMSFGLGKAKLILENVEEIKKFVEEADRKQLVNEITKKYRIEYLYYMTHINNLDSIMEKGIFSMNILEKQNITYEDISYGVVKKSRNKSIKGTNKKVFDYVPLYFANDTPMYYGVLQKSSLKKRIAQENNVILLALDAKYVFSMHKVIFSNMNLLSKDFKIFTDIRDLGKLPWEDIRKKNVYSRENNLCYNPGYRRKKASETLVEDHIPAEAIVKIQVYNNAIKEKINAKYHNKIEVTENQWKKSKDK